MLAAVGLHRQTAVGVHLAAQNLAMLHAQAAGFAAFRPLPDVPAGLAVREGEEQTASVNRRQHRPKPADTATRVALGALTQARGLAVRLRAIALCKGM